MKTEEIINKLNYARTSGLEIAEPEKDELLIQIHKQLDLNQDIIFHPEKRNMRPFYLNSGSAVPVNFRTMNGYKPKTMIFYSNYCELELLRCAFLLNPDDETMLPIYKKTGQRIRSNCFGRFCPTGECYEISIASLRFIAVALAHETEWVNTYMKNITETLLYSDKKIPYQTKFYFLQSLFEINTEASAGYLNRLSHQIRHLSLQLPGRQHEYRLVNGRIIENCLSAFTQ